MPIRINKAMPVVQLLRREQIFVIPESRAASQDIRELEIAILNIMPNKQDTELQLLRLLSNSPLQVRPTFLRLDSHRYKYTSEDYLRQFYRSFSAVRERCFDGLIITGAPLENLPFEEVDYWPEMQEIFAWSATHVTSTIHICWAAQAGLYFHEGIPKYTLPAKLSGVYPHRTLYREENLTRGFNDVFHAPHSRYTGVHREDIAARPDLTILAESDLAGPYLIKDAAHGRIYITGHPEYSRMTLANEYTRDVKKGLEPAIPRRYYEDDDPEKGIHFQWKAHAYLLFSNWLNFEVYQETPYDITTIPQMRQ
ncbi:MAG: homoserine O-succinyltransferase [Lachnospiraceae bacterium]|nr:homoserine O-succinyltransferase [Lachnospiraceae bacterium]